MTVNSQLYGVLLAEALPSVIDSDEEYQRIEAIFETLLDKDRSAEEDRLFDLLANLMEDYESRTLQPLGKAQPVEVLRFLMSENGLAQKDLVEIFGTKSVISEVVNGKREISKVQAKKLAERFRVSADLFI